MAALYDQLTAEEQAQAVAISHRLIDLLGNDESPITPARVAAYFGPAARDALSQRETDARDGRSKTYYLWCVFWRGDANGVTQGERIAEIEGIESHVGLNTVARRIATVIREVHEGEPVSLTDEAAESTLLKRIAGIRVALSRDRIATMRVEYQTQPESAFIMQQGEPSTLQRLSARPATFWLCQALIARADSREQLQREIEEIWAPASGPVKGLGIRRK